MDLAQIFTTKKLILYYIIILGFFLILSTNNLIPYSNVLGLLSISNNYPSGSVLYTEI